MDKLNVIPNIQEAFSQRIVPTITLWNRLEARPRADDFDQALKAEVRDPLWMLTKQWQMGEFRGDDAGSPAFAKIQMAMTQLTKYQADSNSVQLFENDIPLEAKVEQKKFPFHQEHNKASIDIRLLMGRQWLKMLSKSAPGVDKTNFLSLFKFEIPNPEKEQDAVLVAHRESWQFMEAIAEKSMDGYTFYLYLKDNDPTHTASTIAGIAPDAELEALAIKFTNWYERVFLQPEDPNNNAWQPSKMEYNFRVSAPKEKDEIDEKVLTATEYYHGHLDWYNLDIDPLKTRLELAEETIMAPQKRETMSFFPSPLIFDGMPNTRWWQFEEGNVNFGDIKPDTQDINKLLFMEFGLIYSNDWFIVPYTVDSGTIAQVKGLSVTNVFGEKTWVEAAGKGADENWKRWNMFSLNVKGKQNTPADSSLLILPTVEKIQESKPLEEIIILRDEVANMVWAIEKRIPLPIGSPKDGAEAALELRSFYQKLLDDKNIAPVVIPGLMKNDAKIRYEIMNTVPENWIPFIPVHVEGSSREIQLQRASMPRILKNDAPGNAKKIKPRTQLLREGLDGPTIEPYFINEEEIPRAGVRIYHTFQRARWYDGKVVTWYGARKQTGRGEGHSRLAFDQTIPIKK
jgi:hypothetical protein